MHITLSVIERNDRRNNVAICNGINIEISDAPALAGSAKQVAWADDIRKSQTESLTKYVAERFGLVGGATLNAHELDAKVAQMNAGLVNIAASIAAKTDARFWIDGRTLAPVLLIPALGK